MLEQLGVGAGPNRTAACRAGRRRGTGRRATAVDRGTGEVPDAGYPSQAVAPTRDRRDGPAHRLNLRRAKGRPPSRAAIFCSSSSLAMVTSPSLAFKRSRLKAVPSTIAAVALALLHHRLCRDQSAVSPLAQAGDGDVELAGHGLQRLTAQQAGDGGPLAPGRVAPLRPRTAQRSAGVSVRGARRRRLGLVATDLIHRSD